MINTLRPMNREEYAAHWQKESSLFETNKIYEKLSNITPIANTSSGQEPINHATITLGENACINLISTFDKFNISE